MKSLFLAWQAPNRAWFPVGRLDADVAQHRYHFGYTKGAQQAEQAVGFKPLPAFPDFERTYESSELFPLFQNRVLDPGRKDFAAYLASLDLAPANAAHHAGILPKGHAVVVFGNRDASGVFHVVSVGHTSQDMGSWSADN